MMASLQWTIRPDLSAHTTGCREVDDFISKTLGHLDYVLFVPVTSVLAAENCGCFRHRDSKRPKDALHHWENPPAHVPWAEAFRRS